MLDQALLEALRDGFWPLYWIAMFAGAFAFARGRQWCIGRTVIALLFASLAQTIWEGEGYLTWWQHLVIDVPVFVLITMPPRHYWQAVLAAMVFAQLVLHIVWGASGDGAGMARWHWLGCILLGYAKCVVLLLWSGGGRVQRIFDSISGWASGLVLAKASEKLSS